MLPYKLFYSAVIDWKSTDVIGTFLRKVPSKLTDRYKLLMSLLIHYGGVRKLKIVRGQEA